MSSILIRTESDTFVGARQLGELRTDMGIAFAYCYDSLEQADAVARQLGLSDYMLGTYEDLNF